MSDSFTGTTGRPELNIADHRSASHSVWDKPGWDGRGGAERSVARWLVGAAGGILTIEGLRRRGTAGSLYAALGGSLIWWAFADDSAFSTVRHRVAAALERAPWRSADPVHEASADSFPASDAPSWTPTMASGYRRDERAP